MDLERTGSVLWLNQERLELISPRPSFFSFRAACLTLDEQVFNRKPEKTPTILLYQYGEPTHEHPRKSVVS